MCFQCSFAFLQCFEMAPFLSFKCLCIPQKLVCSLLNIIKIFLLEFDNFSRGDCTSRASVRWSSSPNFPSRSSTWGWECHPATKLPISPHSGLLLPSIYLTFPLSAPCPCSLSRCPTLHPPLLEQLSKESTLAS